MNAMTAPQRILIVGATGRLGGALVRRFRAHHQVLTPRRAELDMQRPSDMAAILRGMPFDVLINCAGITSPDTCANAPESAHQANAAAPAVMAAECQRRGARMIHLSTDYVFAGEGVVPLDEEAETHPLSVYGTTKLAGERAVLHACPGALVARVSWLFGPDKASFPDTMLQQARAGGQLSAIADKWSTPTSTEDIAAWLEELLHHPHASGLLHLCNTGSTTWQGYAQTTLDLAHELGLLAQPVSVSGQPLEGFPAFRARRPRYTPLSNNRLTTLLGREVRPWQAALRDYLAASIR